MALVGTYTYEGTTVGETPSTGGQLNTVVTPAQYSTRAAHGTRGVTFPAASPPGYLRYTLPTTAAYTVSAYVYIESQTSGAALPLTFADAAGTRQASVRFHPDGRADMANASNTRQAVGVGTWAVGEWHRLDVTVTENAGNFVTLAVKMYRPAEISIPVSEFEATFSHAAPITQMYVWAGLATWSLTVDTLRIYDTPTNVAAYDPAPDPDPDPDPDPEPEPDPEYVDGVALHNFEDGFPGANIPAGERGVVSVSAPPPIYTNTNPIAGTLSAYFVNETPAPYLDYNVPNTTAFSVTVLVRPIVVGTNAAQFIRLHDTAGQLLICVRMHQSGIFDIANGSLIRQVASDATWTVGQANRVDARFTFADDLVTLTVRAYASATSTTPLAEFATAVPMNGATPGRVRCGASSASWAVSMDDIRRFQTPTWTGTAPVTPPGEVLHAWVGAPTPTGFIVKAKVSGPTQVGLNVSSAANMAFANQHPLQTVSVHGYVTLTPLNVLASGQQFYYQLRDSTGPIGPIGRVRTLPAAGLPADFTVGLAACTLKGNMDGRAHTSLRGWDPDFLVHTGDFYYTSITSAVPNDYEALYADMIQTYPGHDVLMRDIASYYCASDHEAGPDNGDSNNAWTEAHISAYDRVVPHRVADTRSPMRARYQSWTAGRVRFIMTDVRTLDRSPGLNADGAGKTMLGATQKAWLKNELLQAEPLKIIITDPGWMGPYSLTDGEDKWWAYATERQEIIDFIDAYNIQVEIWHGDSHTIGVKTKGLHPWGGMAVLCSAPMAQTGGGRYLTYFDSYYNASGGQARQYMRVTFTDDGDTITRTAVGWDAVADVARVTSVETYDATPPAGSGEVGIWNGSAVVPVTDAAVWDGFSLTPVDLSDLEVR